MRQPRLVFIVLLLTISLVQQLNYALASDYCGQPVPHDIASEGLKKHGGSAPEHPFADPGSDNAAQTNLSGQVIFIPPGASLPIYTDRPLGSGINRVGDIAYANVANGSNFGIPYGTIAELVVLMVEPARRGFAKPGRMQIGVNRLILQNGQSIWLRGLVIDNKGESRLQQQPRGRRAVSTIGKIALGAGVGAAAGAATGAIASGEAGTGALIGTAMGAVIGGIWAATVKGQDVFLPQGMPVLLSVREGTQAYL